MRRLALLPLLFLCVTLAAQTEDDVAQLVTYAARINYFNRLCPQEKVYLHLDNTAYFQGETIWYAANVVDATTGGEAASKVLYVELLSPTGVVLKQQKLKVVDGRCHGSFSLIDTSVEEAIALRGAIGYPSGYYQIRAYTRAMLNFDDAGVFSRVIPVYKAPEKEGEYDDPIMRQYNGKETNRPESKRSEKLDALNIAFFPEGGHLISGLPCRIAFKATDKQGHGVSIEALMDADGNSLTIPLQHNGMGSFTFTPGKRAQKVQAVYEGTPYTFTLPEPDSEGCTLHIMGSTSQRVNKSTDGAASAESNLFGLSRVATDEERSSTSGDSLIVNFAAAGGPSKKLLAYTLTSQGRCHVVDTLTIGTRGCTRTITTASLPTGVYQLTLFDAKGAVYAQRLLFIDNGIQTETISVTAEKAEIHPFDEIRLNLNVNKSTSRRVNKPATFSLAVRDAADYGTAYRDDIRTYMLLSSELKGLIEDPGWYFESEQRSVNSEQIMAKEPQTKVSSDNCSLFTDHSRLDALDLLMLVQGWTRYNWRQMAGVEPFEIRHYTESQLVVDGWAFSRIKETPLADVKIAVRLTAQDRQQRQEATVTTDSLGYWSVGVEDFEGEWDLYMETRQKGDKNAIKTTRVRLERSSKPALNAYAPIEKWLPSYTWNPDEMLTVEEAEDPEYLLPTDSHLLQEVEVTGRRKYIDYYTFKAFDAEKDAELMLDEGSYTYKVEDYLREKGYDLQLSMGDVGDVASSDDYESSRLNYFKNMVKAAPINNRRTFWYIHEGKVNRTAPSYFAGYALDLEEVKSIIVYDDPWVYETFPGITDLLTKQEIDEIANTNRQEEGDPFSPGMYVIDIELNPSRKRRTYVDKNARSTSFEGYSPVVEFYAPTYPNGPIQGDTDYRRTIYWNPEVTTDENGYASVSFYNNGYSRALTFSAEGMTQDGVPIINQ